MHQDCVATPGQFVSPGCPPIVLLLMPLHHRVLVIRTGQVVAVVEGTFDDRQLMSLAAHGVDDNQSSLHTHGRRVLADA